MFSAFFNLIGSLIGMVFGLVGSILGFFGSILGWLIALPFSILGFIGIFALIIPIGLIVVCVCALFRPFF